MGCSRKLYSPVQALSCMPSKCSSVDFPAPEGPMMDTNSPSFTSALMRRNTKVLVGPCSKYFSTLRRTIMGVLIRSLYYDGEQQEIRSQNSEARIQGRTHEAQFYSEPTILNSEF